MEYEDLPTIYCPQRHVLDRILDTGGILSKEELTKRRLPFIRSTTSPEGVEQRLGTNDEVTLYVDKTFYGGNIYGGIGAPRIILDESLLFEDEVYILHQDQHLYDPKRFPEEYPKFEADKKRTTEEKRELLKAYRARGPPGEKPTQEISMLEVHVPKMVALEHWRMLILWSIDAEKYGTDPRLSHVELRTFEMEGKDMCWPHIPAREAYFGSSST